MRTGKENVACNEVRVERYVTNDEFEQRDDKTVAVIPRMQRSLR